MRRIAGLAVVVAMLALPGSALAAFAGANGRIAFERPGVGLFDVASDGSGLRQLTTNGCDSHPSYSPDGRTIVFDSCGGLFAVGADGSARRQIPVPPRLASAVRPVFGADGAHVAFEAGRFVTGVYTEALDGSGLQAVAQHAYGPAWSPLGPIAFAVPQRDAEFCNSTSLEDLWAAQGGRRARLTRNLASYGPDYSADGKRIAFTRDLSASGRDLARVKGRPDCRRLARVRAARRYGEEVFVADASGRGERRLTTRGGRAPAWSPDGTQIVFERRPFVYAMNADGSGVRKLAQGRNPAWQPLPPVP